MYVGQLFFFRMGNLSSCPSPVRNALHPVPLLPSPALILLMHSLFSSVHLRLPLFSILIVLLSRILTPHLVHATPSHFSAFVLDRSSFLALLSPSLSLLALIFSPSLCHVHMSFVPGGHPRPLPLFTTLFPHLRTHTFVACSPILSVSPFVHRCAPSRRHLYLRFLAISFWVLSSQESNWSVS